MAKPNLQKSLLRKLVYGVGKIAKEELRRTDLSGYFNPSNFKWWSPTTGGPPVDLNFVDGGMFDNLGVLALLRRRCSTIIVCNAIDVDVMDVQKPKKLAHKCYDLASLFGRGMSPVVPKPLAKKGYIDTVNERSQVFASEELDSLMDEMRALRTQGKPLVVRKMLPVIPNPLAGVHESYEVDMIFCFNGECVTINYRSSAYKSKFLSKLTFH